MLLSGQVAAGADDGRCTVRLSKGKEPPALSLVCPGGGLSRRNLAAAVRSLALKAKGSVNAYGPDFAAFVMAPRIPFDLFDLFVVSQPTLRRLRFLACAYVSVATALAARQYLPNDATRATYPWRYTHAMTLTIRSNCHRPSRGLDRSSQRSRALADRLREFPRAARRGRDCVVPAQRLRSEPLPLARSLPLHEFPLTPLRLATVSALPMGQVQGAELAKQLKDSLREQDAFRPIPVRCARLRAVGRHGTAERRRGEGQGTCILG